MIVDHRTYSIRPGKVKAWLENYEKICPACAGQAPR